MVALGACLAAFDLRMPAPVAPLHLQWWVLIPMAVICDHIGFHLEIREEAHTFTVSELPLILGCLFASPLTLLISRPIGAILSRAIWRRQPFVKLIFNLALFLFETSVVLAAVHFLRDGRTPTDWVSWPLVLAGVASAQVLCGMAVAMTIRWHGGQVGVPSLVLLTVATSAVNVNLALLASVLLWKAPAAMVLLLAVVAAISAAYRGYGNLSKRYSSLKHLYDFTRVVGADMSAESVLADVLGQARNLLRAEIAEVVLLDEDTGRPAVHQRDTESGVGDTMSMIPRSDPRCAWVEPALSGDAVVVSRSDRRPEWVAVKQQLGVQDLLLAPLRSNDKVIGALLVANRLGDINTFDDDDSRLFETLANHASVAFQNSRLMQQLRSEAERRRREALHDALTGLPNRRLFSQRVEEALAAGDGGVVMLMDLDRFKEVNDTLGHHNGDALLRETANRLGGAIGPADTAARLGGDEFAVLLTGIETAEQARVVANQIVHALRQPFLVEELSLSVEASIGISLAPAHGSDPIALLQKADVAMYQAKTSHESVAVYSADHDTYSPGRLTIASELRRAIENDELLVYYQPKCRLSDGAVVGAEALVRWQHPVRGLLPPDEFIPVAEQTGLIADLTTYVLETAVSQCSRWIATGHRVDVAVNLAVRNLLDPDLPRQVANVLSDRGVPSQCLTLEITESSIMGDTARAVSVLTQLASQGVRLSVDDFGTGYSSLTYLQRLPVDEVKIDKSFVFNVATDPGDAVIVQSIVELGHNLGLSVVAEGVEDQVGWDRLRAMGCDQAQGYHMSKPIPASALTVWLDNRRSEQEARRLAALQEPVVARLALEARTA